MDGRRLRYPFCLVQWIGLDRTGAEKYFGEGVGQWEAAKTLPWRLMESLPSRMPTAGPSKVTSVNLAAQRRSKKDRFGVTPVVALQGARPVESPH
jgi:hypothetical protein